MRKEYYLYISLIILFVIGFFYYNRPLNTQGLTDPGEEYFTLPERTLPSSWNIVNRDYGHDSPKTYEKEQLNSIDDLLKDRNNRTGERTSTYTKTTTGGAIEELYIDTITDFFSSGDSRDIAQYHIDNLAIYTSGYEYYPIRLTRSDIIPRAAGMQSIYRVGSMYTTLLCIEGNQEQCVNNFRTLFRFAQQTKNSGTLISLLIGIVEEGIMMNYIEYLIESNPEQYQFLITMLQSQDYMKAEDSFRNAFISEYTILKNEINRMPLNLLQAYDFISIVNSSESRDPTGFILGVLKTLRVPPRWLFDVPETLSLARSFYYKGITDPYIPNQEFNDEDIITAHRSSGHPLTRKNIIGYHMLNAVIPRLTGIQGRAIDQETRFNNLINR